MSTPSFVQIAPDSTGKKIDNVQLTHDDNTIVQRQVVALGDAAAVDNFLQIASNGAALVKTDGTTQPTQFALTAAQLRSAPFDFATGSGTLVALQSGKSTKIHRIILCSSIQTNIQFQDGSSPLSGNMAVGPDQMTILDFDGEPWFTGTLGQNFNLVSSVSGQIGGTVYYVQN